MSEENKYYQSIENLPLNKFIDCIVDGTLTSLTISGYPTKEELTNAWDFILSEYSELIGTQEYRMYVELYREIALLKITLDQINFLVTTLEWVYDEFFANELNKFLRTDFKFDWNNQETYKAELKKCLARSKALKINLDLKNLQFEAIQEKNNAGSGEKITRQYFTSILITLSDHAKYRIEESIKMSEYCERLKRFSEYCEVMNQQAVKK